VHRIDLDAAQDCLRKVGCTSPRYAEVLHSGFGVAFVRPVGHYSQILWIPSAQEFLERRIS